MDESEIVDRAGRTGAPDHPQSNGVHADRVAEWESILGTIRAGKASLDAMNARVVDRVMANLRFVEAPQRPRAAVRAPAGVWRRLAGLSVACGLVLVAALVAVRSVGPIEPTLAPDMNSAKVRVDRSEDRIQVRVVPDAWSLQQALDAVPEGSRVTMHAVEVRGEFVLEKPMTIESRSGPIVLGRS